MGGLLGSAWSRLGRIPFLVVARRLPLSGRGWAAALAALVVVGGVLPNGVTLAMGWLVTRIEESVAAGATSGLVWPLLVLGGLLVLSNAHGPVLEAVGQLMGGRYDTELRNEILEAAAAPAGIAHLEDPRVADRLAPAEELVHGWLTAASVRGIATTGMWRVQGLVAAVILLRYRWWAPVIVFVAYRVMRSFKIKTGYMFLRRMESNSQGLRRARYVRRLVQSGEAAKEGRIFGVGGWFIDRYWTDWNGGMEELWEERRLHLRWTLPVSLVTYGVIGFVAYRIGMAALDGEFGLGVAVVLLQSLYRMEGMSAAGDGDWQLQVGAQRAENALKVRDLAQRPDSALIGGRDAPEAVECIRFEGVGFHYPGQDRLILRGLDLDIAVGSSLAIVGENGAGKTTLIKLLCRLYDPTEGRITVDGVDLRDLDPVSWRRRVGVIFQDFVKYDVAARENISFGAVGLDDPDALRESARLAGADRFLDEAGWDAPLSRRYEGGVDLSGGEWQRVALARALYAVRGGARTLILDEPTANLDVRAEAELYERFLEITHGVTTILISHRFSTVRMADRICVIEHGQVVEQGSHDELLAAAGRYRELFTLQAAAYRDDMAGA